MFEYHGWVAIKDSVDGPFEAADGLTHAARDAVGDVLARVSNDLQTADLRYSNGSCHVWLAGKRNHRQEAVIEAFREIAEVAPWSYGLLHVFDDESATDGNNWIAWVMKRGTVVAHPDEFLSPHIAEVEDPDVEGEVR